MTRNDRDADIAFVEAVARLLREEDLTEIEIRRDYDQDDTLSVRVSRVGPAPHSVAPLPQAVMPAPEQPAPERAGEWPGPQVAGAAPDPAADPGAVVSPMVGTVYLQPEPGAAPFVAEGQAVEEGQTLLIIEAMKTMNQIPAPRSGTVRRVLVEDGSPVEYGAPLVILA